MAKGLGHWYVEIEKQGTWRGAVHTWMNRYVMSGVDPTSAQAASTISALKNIENALYPQVTAGTGVGFVKGTAYLSTGGAPLTTQGYNTTLAAATATGFSGPTGGYTSLSFAGQLENCLETRTLLTGLSSTGKPVYLRKYFRGFYAGTEDSFGAAPILAADITKATGTIAPWFTGMTTGSYTVIGVSGRQAAIAPTVQVWLGNHQVPRGKKRKLMVAGLGIASAQIDSFLLGVSAAGRLETNGTIPDLAPLG